MYDVTSGGGSVDEISLRSRAQATPLQASGRFGGMHGCLKKCQDFTVDVQTVSVSMKSKKS